MHQTHANIAQNACTCLLEAVKYGLAPSSAKSRHSTWDLNLEKPKRKVGQHQPMAGSARPAWGNRCGPGKRSGPVISAEPVLDVHY